MIEIFIVSYILLAFSFPLLSLALTLGAGTTWIIYRGSFLLKNQPENGRPIIWYSMKATAVNFILSIILGGAMAFFVYYVIYDNYYLLLFNFAFCSIIALRWFDFSHKIFEHKIIKLKSHSERPFSPIIEKKNKGDGDAPLFAMCIGLTKKTGVGGGMIPTFLDSGYIFVDNKKLYFEGVFLRQMFGRDTVVNLEKISSEKIKVYPRIEKAQFNADAYLFILKYQFYPFKSRGSRDRIIEILKTSLVSPMEGLHIDEVKDKMQIAIPK
ncbi:MAG: hypothetical protein ACQ9MH_01290 [Nitrospinales bacterium]